MATNVKAIEIGGEIDAQRKLHLDELLPVTGPSRVRVIILLSEDETIDEQAWLQAAARNPAFAFLGDADEDIYAATDGKPFCD